MGFSKGRTSLTKEDVLNRVSEAQLLAFYLGIYEVPTVINSPLRQDKKPSFGLYSSDGKRIYYRDFAKGDKGSLFDLLGKLWGITAFDKILTKVYNDIPKMKGDANIVKYIPKITSYSQTSNTELLCKIRDWRDYDIDYWESYGITLPWLQYAEVYPISHKIIVKDNYQFVLGTDKYAYAFVEHKEGKETLKIYQPFNTFGFKWANKHDKSVISLWTKVPKQGFIVCICSSLKDALCLWANTNIPSLAVQGEGYSMSNTAINELKKRFKHVCIMLDNDLVGLQDATKLAENTGFTNVVLPQFEGGKDIADLYHKLRDPQLFKEQMLKIFKSSLKL